MTPPLDNHLAISVASQGVSVLCHSQPPTDTSPMSTFSVHRFAVSDSVSVLILRGELDLLAAASLRSALGDLAADGCRRLVLDVSPLQFVDSTGLGVLIAFQRTLGQPLAVAEPRAFVSDVLDIADVTDTFDVFSPLDDALAHSGVAGVV